MKWILLAIVSGIILYLFIRRRKSKYDKDEIIDNISDLFE